VYEGLRASDPDRGLHPDAFAFAGNNVMPRHLGGDTARAGRPLQPDFRGRQFLHGPAFRTGASTSAASRWKTVPDPSPADLDEWRELNLRWFQFGAFVPTVPLHGEEPFREIYSLAPEGSEVYSSLAYYDRLRYRLMPYHLYSGRRCRTARRQRSCAAW